MKMLWRIFALAIILFPSANLWAITAGFNIQGRLTDANGVNRNEASLGVVFSIYSVDREGTSVWSETRTVKVQNGNFQVELTGEVLENAVKDLPEAYLEIQVVGEAAMVPRQRLLRSPLPTVNMVGAVMFFAGATCPYGWEILNGSTLPVAGKYSSLFSQIRYLYGGSGNNFVLPNMSDGAFIRSSGGFADVTGTKQGDAFQGHQHKVGRRDGFDPGGWGFMDWRANGSNLYTVTHNAGTPAADLIAKSIESDSVNGNPVYGPETRPKNYAMTPCIKY